MSLPALPLFERRPQFDDDDARRELMGLTQVDRDAIEEALSQWRLAMECIINGGLRLIQDSMPPDADQLIDYAESTIDNNPDLQARMEQRRSIRERRIALGKITGEPKQWRLANPGREEKLPGHIGPAAWKARDHLNKMAACLSQLRSPMAPWLFQAELAANIHGMPPQLLAHLGEMYAAALTPPDLGGTSAVPEQQGSGDASGVGPVVG